MLIFREEPKTLACTAGKRTLEISLCIFTVQRDLDCYSKKICFKVCLGLISFIWMFCKKNKNVILYINNVN